MSNIRLDREREALLRRVLHIGLLAVKEDRLSAFLAHTESELGVQLEHLKQIFDLKEQVFFQSTQKGTVAEEEVTGFTFLDHMEC
jgi:CMP-2-keto-3-deoxyoctulosonic acid synthetase